MVQGITPRQLDYENRLSWPKIILSSNTDQSLIRELSKVYCPSQKIPHTLDSFRTLPSRVSHFLLLPNLRPKECLHAP